MIFDNTKLCPQFPANPDRCKVNPFETMENDVLTCSEKNIGDTSSGFRICRFQLMGKCTHEYAKFCHVAGTHCSNLKAQSISISWIIITIWNNPSVVNGGWLATLILHNYHGRVSWMIINSLMVVGGLGGQGIVSMHLLTWCARNVQSWSHVECSVIRRADFYLADLKWWILLSQAPTWEANFRIIRRCLGAFF